MITEEQFRKFVEIHAIIKPLVIEKIKEVYEIEHDFPLFYKVKDIRYSSSRKKFKIRLVSKNTQKEEEIYLDPVYLYDRNAINILSNKIRIEKENLQRQAKQEYEKQQLEKIKGEETKLRELATKLGYVILKQ